MAKKVADQLVDTLEKAGVRRIYAVTGDSLNEVNEAVRKNGRLRPALAALHHVHLAAGREPRVRLLGHPHDARRPDAV